MAEKNRYFLKIPVDYMQGDLTLDRLRHRDNGYELVHIYFTLLAIAAPDGGFIYYENPADYVEYISLRHDLNAERVIQALHECQDLNLIELSENHIYFNDAPKLISKECGSAERQRRYKAAHPEKYPKKIKEPEQDFNAERHLVTKDSCRNRYQMTQERYIITSSRYIITPSKDKRYKITQERDKVTPKNTSLLDTYIINNKLINYLRESKESKKSEEPLKERAPERALKAQRIVDLYNEKCPSLPKCIKLTEPIIDSISILLRRYTIKDFIHVFEYAEDNDFLKGKKNGANYKSWKGASLKFLINEKKFKNVLNGVYDDYGGGSRIPDKIMNFCNFEQRNINFNELEGMLLSN